MSRLVMGHRQDPGRPIEAEPVVLAVDGQQLDLVLDDGVALSFDLEEFERALAGERAPDSRAA